MEISNKYKIALALVIIIPIAVFFGKNYLVDMSVDRLNGMADHSKYTSVVDITKSNSNVFDTLKNTDYDVAEVGIFDNVSTAVLSQYFRRVIKPRPASSTVASGPVVPVVEDEVSFIYVSDYSKFAIINGDLYEQGDEITPGKKILQIAQNGVQIRSEGKVKWLQLN